MTENPDTSQEHLEAMAEALQDMAKRSRYFGNGYDDILLDEVAKLLRAIAAKPTGKATVMPAEPPRPQTSYDD